MDDTAKMTAGIKSGQKENTKPLVDKVAEAKPVDHLGAYASLSLRSAVPAELPRLAGWLFPGRRPEGAQRTCHRAPAPRWHPFEDLRDGRTAMLDEDLDQLSSVVGQLQHQVASIQG